MALYGYHQLSITSCLKGKSKVQVVEYHIENKQQVLQLLKDNLTMAHNFMKQQENQYRSEISFDEMKSHTILRTWMLVQTSNYKQFQVRTKQSYDTSFLTLSMRS